MLCRSCGRDIANGTVVCPNCGHAAQTLSFQTNRLGGDGKNVEYVTEKYSGQKGIYEGRAKEHNNIFAGLVFMGIVLLIIFGIVIANLLA